jgi:hypothetical protein
MIKNSLLCPFCFNHILPDQFLYDSEGEGHKDDLKFLNELSSIIDSRLIHLKLNKYCPHCIEKLPDCLSMFPSKTIPIIGSSGAGMSCFTTVMLESLKKYGSKVGIGIVPQTPYSDVFQIDNKKMLYENHYVLPCTASGCESPLIYRSGNYDNDLIYNFYDYSGISNLNFELNIRDTRAIPNSDAIILLIDPLSILELRNKAFSVNNEMATNSDVAGAEYYYQYDLLIDFITGFIKHINKINSEDNIDIPIAVVINKLDLFYDDILSTCINGDKLLLPSSYTEFGYFDYLELYEIDRILTEWLIKNGENKIVSALKTNFNFEQTSKKEKNCLIFGVSTLGSAPNGDGTVPIIKPHRVLDPILWLMAEHNLIRSKNKHCI